ncbi:MAG: ABC transporter permease [Methylococcus sp.]|nr:ABC transporter permease [Methylococcus sp.]
MSTLSADIRTLPKRGFRIGTLPAAFHATHYRGLLIPLVLLVLWEVAAQFHWINPILLASPSIIFHGFDRSLTEGDLLLNLQLSVTRMGLGWLAGSLIGLAVGLAIGLSRTADRVLGPTLHAFRQIAPFAWIPLISVWFGLGDSAKVAFVALVVFFPVVVNTYEGIRGVPKQLIEVSRVLMFSKARLIRSVILPAAAPAILNGLELGFLYAWLSTIGAEYLMNATGGVGSMMESAQESLEMDIVFVGVIVSGLIGFGISLSVRLARTRLLHWRKSFA